MVGLAIANAKHQIKAMANNATFTVKLAFWDLEATEMPQNRLTVIKVRLKTLANIIDTEIKNKIRAFPFLLQNLKNQSYQ